MKSFVRANNLHNSAIQMIFAENKYLEKMDNKTNNHSKQNKTASKDEVDDLIKITQKNKLQNEVLKKSLDLIMVESKKTGKVL